MENFLLNWGLDLEKLFHPDWDESRVLQSDVESSCGISLRLGWILPSSVRLTSAVGKMVDGGMEGEVRLDTG